MAAAITFLQTSGSASDLTTYTFSSVNFGTASADRYLIATPVGRSSDGTARTVSSVTIGGVTATISNQVASSGSMASIVIAAVPTGTSGDIVVTWSGAMGNCDLGLWTTTGVGSATATNSGTSTANPGTFDLDIDAGGIAVGISTVDVGGATTTWAGITESFDGLQSSGNDFTGACLAFATTQTNLTISATRSSSSRPAFVTASYPGAAASGPANLKSLNTNLKANIKSYNTNVIANVKSVNTNV